MTEPDESRLALVIGGHHAGELVQQDGRYTLTYLDTWRLKRGSTPISVSMPIRQRVHTDETVRPFLWGLLPDNEAVITRWARQYQVSARNPFALLKYVGEDCAGAVQWVRPQRLDGILRGEGGVDWIDETEIAQRIRQLRRDPAAWHVARESGQFSLAGAQAKTALFYDANAPGWGLPWGNVPTTHILKPAVAGLDEHDLNEHLCLHAARRLGLVAATSSLQSFEDERVIVVERYDRVHARDGRLLRVHQEDCCQALGLLPTAKYQNEGGPSPESIIALLRRVVRPLASAAPSVARFVDALAFNWIIAGTDAHAKNYSLLLSADQVRLAPLYDLASALPYEQMYLPKLKLAMRIGGEYRVEAIEGRHWRRFAEANDLDPKAVVERVRELAERAPEAFEAVAADSVVRELGSELPGRLVAAISERARVCVRAMGK